MNIKYTLAGTLQTVYSNIPGVLSISGNTTSDQLLLGNTGIISVPTIVTYMIITGILIFIFIFIITVYTFLFLTRHLDLMTKVTVKIEELQRNILFKKMGNVDLFSWNGIIKNEPISNESPLVFGIKKDTFKDYIAKKFILETIEDITISNADNKLINFDISTKKGKKSGTLSLDKDRKVAILNINSIELDQFNVKEKNKDSNVEEKNKDFVTIQPPQNQLANIDFDVIGTSDY